MIAVPLLRSSDDAERAILGLALHDPRAYFATVERYRLGIEHFGDWLNRRIFAEIAVLAAEGATPEPDAVARKIADLEGEHVLPRLGELSHHACVTGNAPWWAEQLRVHRTRNAIQRGADGIRECADAQNVDGAIEVAEGLVDTIAEQMRQPSATHVRDLLGAWTRRFVDIRAQGSAPRLVGWPILDTAIGGLQPGELLVLGGPTSAGKSSLIRCLAVDLATAGQHVGIVSTEDTTDTWLTRMVADRTGIDIARLRGATFDEEQWGEIIRAAADASRLPLRIAVLRSGARIADVLAAMRQVADGPEALVCVDYLQAIRDRDARGRHSELSDALAAMKGLAGELGCRLIVASQMNREGVRESRTAAPRLTSLKETGDAEVMAEAVALLWCTRQHEDQRDHEEDCMELHVVKAKNGRRRALPLRWIGARTRYEEAI